MESIEFTDSNDVFEYIKEYLDEVDITQLTDIYERIFREGLAQTLRYQILENYVSYMDDTLEKIKTTQDADVFIKRYILGEK